MRISREKINKLAHAVADSLADMDNVDFVEDRNSIRLEARRLLENLMAQEAKIDAKLNFFCPIPAFETTNHDLAGLIIPVLEQMRNIEVHLQDSMGRPGVQVNGDKSTGAAQCKNIALAKLLFIGPEG